MGKSSNNRRNRKLRAQATFTELVGIRDGHLPPNPTRERSPDLELPRQNADQYTADGALIVVADDDLEIPDISIADLPPGRHDDDRLFAWLLQ